MLKKIMGKVAILALFLAACIACEKDFSTIGTDIISNRNFGTDSIHAKVFAYNRKLNAVRTNGLSLYQLGRYTDPIYGQTEATIVSQLSLISNNPEFGGLSQEEEDAATDENETVTAVYLDIPFFNNTSATDTDGDGVVNSLDVDPNDPNSDTDGDDVSDAEETASGTNPLNSDTDGDGISDDMDDDTAVNQFPRTFQIDSIYGNREATFNILVEELTFYLGDLDPESGFQDAQEYFSNEDFTGFTSIQLADETIEGIDDQEIVIYNEDDPETTDVDESEQIATRLSPRIRIPLDNAFFQTQILDAEGSPQIANNNNFRDYLRGVVISTDGYSEDILMLLDFEDANITIEYEYDTEDDEGGIVVEESSFTLNLSGNVINTFVNDPYDGAITAEIDNGINASQLYLKGGSGTFVELKLFDEDDAITPNLDEIRANGWLINEANLTFYVDRETINTFAMGQEVIEPPRVYLYNLENELFLIDYFDDPTINTTNSLQSRTIHGGILEEDDSENGVRYKIRLTEHINRIIRKDSTNVRLGLVVTSDINNPITGTAELDGAEEGFSPIATTVNPLGTILFGSDVPPEDEDKRLKLEIYYTRPQ